MRSGQGELAWAPWDILQCPWPPPARYHVTSLYLKQPEALLDVARVPGRGGGEAFPLEKHCSRMFLGLNEADSQGGPPPALLLLLLLLGV